MGAAAYWLAKHGLPAFGRFAGSLAGAPIPAALAASQVMEPVPANKGEVPNYVKGPNGYMPNPSLTKNPMTGAPLPMQLAPAPSMALPPLDPLGPSSGTMGGPASAFAPVGPASRFSGSPSAPVAAPAPVTTGSAAAAPMPPQQTAAAPSIPMPRPRPAMSFDPFSVPGADPRLANMADPSMLNLGGPLQARTVSDGEGGFMNDYYTKKLFGIF